MHFASNSLIAKPSRGLKSSRDKLSVDLKNQILAKVLYSSILKILLIRNNKLTLYTYK